jgi:hypothetical protein
MSIWLTFDLALPQAGSLRAFGFPIHLKEILI